MLLGDLEPGDVVHWPGIHSLRNEIDVVVAKDDPWIFVLELSNGKVRMRGVETRFSADARLLVSPRGT